MKHLTTFALTAFLAGTLAATDASAVEYSYSGEDALTAALVATHFTGQGNVTVGTADGLKGTFVLENPNMSKSHDVFTLEGNALVGVAPAGMYFSNVKVEGPNGVEFTVYASATELNASNYTTGTELGTVTDAKDLAIANDDAYSYIVLADGMDDVTSITFKYKQEGAAGPMGGIDHITRDALKAQNPSGSFDSPWYGGEGVVVNPTASLKFDSGSKYEMTGVIAGYNDYRAGAFWCFEDTYPANSIINTTPGGYITKISADFLDYADKLTIYVSNEPINPESPYTGSDWKQLTQSGDSKHYEWIADGLYQYVYFGQSQQLLSDLSIEWSKEKPAIKAKTPEINSWDDPFGPGSTVNVRVDGNFYLDVKVYLDNAIVEDLSKRYEENSASFKVPGTVGQTVKVEAFAYADGYVDSEAATFEKELEMPRAARPHQVGNVRDACPGLKVVYDTDTEGANITYTIKIQENQNYTIVKEFEAVTAPAPATVTIPEEAEVGQTVIVTYKATKEGYQDSYEMDDYISIIDKKLEAPYLRLEDGVEVEQGTDLTIEKSDAAKYVNYTINDGEVQTSTESYVHVILNENCTVTAWCSGDEPFEDSDKVSATYKVLVFGELHHVLTPETFTTSTDDLKNNNKKRYEAEVNGTNYVYDGGLWPERVWDNSTFTYVDAYHFYFATSGSILYNDQAIANGINRIMLTSDNSWAESFIIISEDKVESADGLNGDDEIEADKMVRVHVTNDMLGKWINVADYVASPADAPQAREASSKKTFKPNYLAIFEPASTFNSNIKRVVVEKNSVPTGVSGIEAEMDGTEVIYDLNGVRMNSENLAPGIYIRKAGNKTSKFVVK